MATRAKIKSVSCLFVGCAYVLFIIFTMDQIILHRFGLGPRTPTTAPAAFSSSGTCGGSRHGFLNEDSHSDSAADDEIGTRTMASLPNNVLLSIQQLLEGMIRSVGQRICAMSYLIIFMAATLVLLLRPQAQATVGVNLLQCVWPLWLAYDSIGPIPNFSSSCILFFFNIFFRTFLTAYVWHFSTLWKLPHCPLQEIKFGKLKIAALFSLTFLHSFWPLNSYLYLGLSIYITLRKIALLATLFVKEFNEVAQAFEDAIVRLENPEPDTPPHLYQLLLPVVPQEQRARAGPELGEAFGIPFIKGVILGIKLFKLFVFMDPGPGPLNFTNESFQAVAQGVLGKLQQYFGGLANATKFVSLFWILKAVYNTMAHCQDRQSLTNFGFCVLSNGTGTLVDIWAMTWFFIMLSCWIGKGLSVIINCSSEPDNTSGTINRMSCWSGSHLFPLCVRTGMTSMAPARRLNALVTNVFLLLAFQLHIIHYKLSAPLTSFNQFGLMQFRCILVSILFLCVTTFGMCWQFQQNPSNPNFWFSIFTYALAFNLKLLSTLAICLVNFIRTKFVLVGIDTQPHLQDVVVNIRRSSIEIVLEMITYYLELFSTLVDLALVLCLCIQFAIAMTFDTVATIVTFVINEQMWNADFLRKYAFQKLKQLSVMRKTFRVNKFRNASRAQLEDKRDDVCSICRCEMTFAKVNQCGHVFHDLCLRQLLLYSIRNCPLCQAELKA